MVEVRATDLRERYDRATADLDPPFAVVDLEAFRANAAALVRRARGVPIRVASKSLRCRALLQRVLEMDGFQGVMSFTLPEAMWLAGHGVGDLLVAYPSADRDGLRRLAGDEGLARAVTIMVDDVAHLDLVDAAVGDGPRHPIRVCIDLDASWRVLGLHVGVRRSPLHAPEEAAALARDVVSRPAFRLVGLMGYEGQIAGMGDAPAPVHWMQRRSAAELAPRRAAAVQAVRAVAPLEFVNGGGTGSLESSVADRSLTEVTAGSGLFGPALFDRYRAFRPRPAALFALPVVRRPAKGIVTVLGGGYPASGPSLRDRLPQPYLPAGLRLSRTEGAGEVQTPLSGATEGLRVGDRVWFRHAKAGEVCERFGTLHLVEGDRVVEAVPTYRGEGRSFL